MKAIGVWSFVRQNKLVEVGAFLSGALRKSREDGLTRETLDPILS